MAIGSEARSTFLAIVKGDASQAVTEFKKLGSSVEKSTKGAEGSVGKFKQATSGAFSEIKANAGLMAAGAGAAIGAFALNATQQFSDLGVAVGKFSDATGLGLDAASRWVEVSSDLGIETGTLQSALNKLNRSIDPKLFKEYGIEIARTAQGATDVNGTFLNVIDRLNEIKDPAERAKVATKLLGRNWQEMAELISKGSPELRKALESVSDAKIYTPEERKQAEQYRDVMADLRDVYEDFTLKVGAMSIPIVTSIVDGLVNMADAADKAYTAMNNLRNFGPVSWLEDAANFPMDVADGVGAGIDVLTKGVGEFEVAGHKFKVTVKDAGEESNRAAEYVDFLKDRFYAARKASDDMAKSEKGVHDRTRDLRQALHDLNDIQLDSIGAKLDAVTAYNDFVIAQRDYDEATKDSANSTEDLAKQANDLAVQAAELNRAQQEASGGTQTAAERTWILMGAYNEMQGKLKKGSPLWNAIEAYKNALLTIPSNVNTTIRVNGKVVKDNTSGKQGGGALTVGTAASGTRSARSGMYLVGENGPELVSMRGGERVYPTPQTMSMLGGGGGGDVHITLKLGDEELKRITVRQNQLQRGLR